MIGVSVGVFALALLVLAGAGLLCAGRGVWRVVVAQVRRRALSMASYRFRALMIGLNVAIALALLLWLGDDLLLPLLEPFLSGDRGDFFVHFAVGALAWPAVWSGFQASSQAIREEQMLGTLEVLAATPMGLLALPLGAFLRRWLFAVATGAVVVMTVAALVSSSILPLAAIPVVLGALLLGGILLWGLGLGFAVLTLAYKEVGGLNQILHLAILALSGAYFPLDALPWGLGTVAQAFPLSLTFEIIRGAVLGTPSAQDLLLQSTLLAVAATGAALIGTALLRGGLERIRQGGRLQGY